MVSSPPKPPPDDLPSDEFEKTSAMTRLDLEPLLVAAKTAERAPIDPSLEETGEIPVEVLRALRESLQRYTPRTTPPTRQAPRSGDFDFAMGRLPDELKARVKVAMAMVAAGATEASDEFVADYLRKDVALHAARGSLEALLVAMGEKTYSKKIAAAYATASRPKTQRLQLGSSNTVEEQPIVQGELIES